MTIPTKFHTLVTLSELTVAKEKKDTLNYPLSATLLRKFNPAALLSNNDVPLVCNHTEINCNGKNRNLFIPEYQKRLKKCLSPIRTLPTLLTIKTEMHMRVNRIR